jgi:hypothetical protein
MSAFDLLRVASESAIRTEEGSEEAARRTRGPASDRGPRQRRRGVTAAVKEHLDARTASTGRHAERASAALPQHRQHALDVLARTKTIGSTVEAATGIGEAFEAADFHLIDATAYRVHAERAENRLLKFDRLDSGDPGAAAPAAQRDFVFVGGPLSLQRWAVEHGTGFAACTRRRPPLALRCRQRIKRPEHGKTMRTPSLRVNRLTSQPINLHKVSARASG